MRLEPAGGPELAQAGLQPLLAALLAALLTALPAAALPVSSPATTPRTLSGLSLTDALLHLQRRGLELIFTNRVVTPDMRVESEPAGATLPELLTDLLVPHGLVAREGPDGVFVVIPAPAPPASQEVTEVPPVRHWVNDEIVVRPSNVSLLNREPSSPFAFGPQELDGLPQLGGDAFRAMALVPGTTTNDVTARFSVRGGRSDEVLIRLDGQELYEPYHLRDYDAALSIVPADTLSDVTLTTGGFPASRGDRMGGVLDLRTPTPAGPRRTRLGIGLLSALATGSGALPGNLGGWTLTARRGSAEVAESLIGEDSPRFWGAFGRIDLRPGPGSRLSIHGLSSDDELELRETIDGETKRFDTGYDSRYAWLTHEALLGQRTLLQTRASWVTSRRDRRGDESEEEGAFAIRDRRRMRVLGLFQTASVQLTPGHVLEIGAEARRFDTSFDYRNRFERELDVLAPFSPPRPERFALRRDLAGDHLGMWISDRFRGFDRLTAEVGLRYDRHTLTDDTLWSPRLNVAWQAGETNLVRASWGRFHQSQRPYELLVEDGQTKLQGAERAEHWVLGYERLLGVAGARAGEERSGAALRVELFRRRITNPRVRWENLLEPVNVFPEIEPDRVLIAPRRSTAEGVEVLLRGELGRRSRVWLAYTWSESRDLVDGRRVPRALDQTHALAANLTRPFGRHWTLSLAWHYHSGWPTTPVAVQESDAGGGAEPAPVFASLRSDRLPDYHRLDLRASRAWALRGSTVELFVDVQNVYDRKNVGGFDLGFDEDAGELDLVPEPWPGILPSLGVTWEF